MYWQIGKRINIEILDNQRAEYGKLIIASVMRQLREEDSFTLDDIRELVN
jgi:hypothetical protein